MIALLVRTALLMLLPAALPCHANAVSPAETPAAAEDASGAIGIAGALQAAVTHNPEVLTRKAELAAKGYAVWGARAARLPTLTGQAGSDDRAFDRGSVAVKMPLWAFGRIHNGVKQAKADVDAEVWALRQVERQLIEDTAATYATVAGIRARAEVADRNIAEHERLYERVERRRAGQLASEADVRLAWSRLVQARAQRSRIDGELAIAMAELEALTQTPVETEVDVDPVYAELPSDAEIRKLAVEKHATVREKHLRLEVLRIEVKQARVSSLPTVFAQYERNFADRLSGSDATRIGVVVEANFDGSGLVSASRALGASARLRGAEHDLEAARTEVIRRARTLMLNRHVQAELDRSQREALEAVEATKESFVRQHESGRKSWLDVLNVQRELAELAFQVAQTQNDWLVLSLRVAALTGRLDRLAGVEEL